jgi:transaldolase
MQGGDMSKLHDLHKLGQSTWLNYMRYSYINSGQLRQAIADGIQGVTVNAAVFTQTITQYDDYDPAINQLMAEGTPYKQIHEHLMLDDARRTADLLHMVYEESGRWDGYVSLEMDPGLAQDSTEMAATARHLLHTLDRANAMVEIPATLPGCDAIQTLIADCESLNITHIFTITDFERAAQAYIGGLERLLARQSAWRVLPTAVASFSIGAIDNAIDPLLRNKDRPDLCGKTAIALAKLLYQRYRQIFIGPRWEQLTRYKARPLRPKWTRTAPADPSLSLTYYTNALIGSETIVTFSPETMNAFMANGEPALTLTMDIGGAEAHLEELAKAGIDLDKIVHHLQAEYQAAGVAQYQALIKAVIQRSVALGIAA